MTGQHDRQWNVLSSQVTIMAGPCPLTSCYFKPWVYNKRFCVSKLTNLKMTVDKYLLKRQMANGSFDTDKCVIAFEYL